MGRITSYPLIEAARQNDLTEVVTLLYQGSCDVNMKEDYKVGDTITYTAAHWAAHNGNVEMLRFLIEVGKADVELKHNYGMNCLHTATVCNQLEVVKYLVEKVLNIDEGGFEGRSPLWTASWKGHLEVVDFLLSKGANVEKIRGCDNSTPLIIASQQGNLETVELLIEKGKANIAAKDKNGKTALDHAIKKGHKEIQTFLKNAQNKTQSEGATEIDSLRRNIESMKNTEEELKKAFKVNEKITNKKEVIKAKEQDLKAIQKDLESFQAELTIKLKGKTNLENEISAMKAEIARLMKTPDFKDESEVLRLTKDLSDIEYLRTLLKQKDTGKFSCYICFERPQSQVFSCVECSYWVCMDCKSQLRICPQCRIDLDSKPMIRNRAIEDLLNV